MTTINAISANQTEGLKAIIDALLIVLNKKEKFIIQKRFALTDKERSTLENIGGQLGITRERVRQIENNAITKLQRHSDHTQLKVINELGEKILNQSGNLMNEDILISQIIKIINKTYPSAGINDIQLSLTLCKNLKKTFNTILYKPHWRVKSLSNKVISEISDIAIKILNKRKDVITIEELSQKIQEKTTGKTPPSEELINSIMETDKRIKIVSEGIGLIKWRHINPKTLKDKINFILDKSRTPLHFIEIANKITEANFDHKNINIQAVHNELIRNTQFVLIGRGIYALKEWGYEKGTVSDVIKKILTEEKDKTLSQKKIIDEVLKQRQVKKITIMLNLKNRPEFKRVGREAYKLTA